MRIRIFSFSRAYPFFTAAAADLLAHAVFDQLCQLLLARMRVDGLHLGRDLAADALTADLHERGQVRQ